MENKFDIGDLFMNGENHRGKIPPGEFKVTTLENPLLSKQVVTSKRNPSTSYQPIVEPSSIHNWTCNVVTVSHFNAWLKVRD